MILNLMGQCKPFFEISVFRETIVFFHNRAPIKSIPQKKFSLGQFPCIPKENGLKAQKKQQTIEQTGHQTHGDQS